MIAYAFPSVSPAQNSETGKKESTAHRLSQLCQPCGKPSSNLSPSHQSSVARIAKNGFATGSGVSKSAKVVLVLSVKNKELTEAEAMRRYTEDKSGGTPSHP
jgi:hypothetical protein